MEIIHAHGKVSRDEVTELVKLALDAQTHVKDPMKDSVSSVFSDFSWKKAGFGLAREITTSHFHVEDSDLFDSCIEDQVGVVFFTAPFSALRRATVPLAALILGSVNIHGSISVFHSLIKPLELARDDAVKRPLIPIQNKPQFLKVSSGISEHVDPVFYGDPKAAAFKTLAIT